MMRRSSSRRTSSGVLPATATASAGVVCCVALSCLVSAISLLTPLDHLPGMCPYHLSVVSVISKSPEMGEFRWNKAAAKEQEKIDALFAQYVDRNEESCIGPEGIEALCQDLGLSPTDIQVLLLAWKLQASRQGYFSLDEWRRGLKAMRVDSLEKLKKALPILQQEVQVLDITVIQAQFLFGGKFGDSCTRVTFEHSLLFETVTKDGLSKPLAVSYRMPRFQVANLYTFKEFYTFSFQYCLTEPRQKTLDLETACQMLELVLGPRPHLSNFVQFLQEQTEYKAMNLDQWNAFLRFCDEIKPDLSNYDENQAWPLLLDNFVEWALCSALGLILVVATGSTADLGLGEGDTISALDRSK
ncbi:hypothetical protein AXG93_3817s1020 [Marchantia polymorpha subsp. ruderalis]|uniref:Defective in cullin neddylation protein n=1 Tax=Marchantia polymorpha subsp. ruderalis TaxID=1480154 RepID=A0A176W0E7_MARPO|nr:hypothetical protein AXG93_3817s1020 [Marchantia polymorpha subsp. ruderalis]